MSGSDYRTQEDLILVGQSMRRRPTPRFSDNDPMIERVSRLIEEVGNEIENSGGNANKELRRARRDLVKAKGRLESAARG